MEQLSNFFSNTANLVNEWLSVNTWFVFFAIIILVMVMGFFIHFLIVFATRACILKDMAKEDLTEVLNSLYSVTANVFDEADYFRLVRAFLEKNLAATNFYEYHDLYFNLRGRGKGDVKSLLRRVFSGRGEDFWARLFFREFIDEKEEEIKKLTDFFEEFDIEYEKKIWHYIWRDLNRYDANFLHVSDKNLSEKLLDKIAWAKLLAEEGYLAVV